MSLREKYDSDLRRLEEAVRQMGEDVRQALVQSLQSVEEKNRELARQVIEGDRDIDSQEREIEHLCMTLLLRQQPIASDLRQVSGALKMVTDLERMGDHAADIAEVGLALKPEAVFSEGLRRMARNALEMEREALEAFLARDLNKADQVIKADDEQDAQFEAVKQDLVIRLAADPGGADEALDLLMIAKYMERLSDHAVNVAEWARFCQTGLYRGEQIV